MPSDELQTLWQCQPVTRTPIDLETLRRKASRLQGSVRARNLRESVAGLVAIVVLTIFGLGKADLLQRASFALLAAGTAYVIWHLWRHGRAAALPEDLALTDAVTFHRRELTRQRDLLRGVLRWYLAPFLPGWVLGALHAAERSWIPAAGMLAIAGVSVWFVRRINQQAANCLDRQIAELSNSAD
jgi:hypothetical protein